MPPMGVMRLFLALVVAAAHWRASALGSSGIPFLDYYALGFNAGYAVMFFYVISGFLITFTLTRNYSLDFAGARAFYRNRFIRIFSLYWPLVLMTFVLVPAAWAEFLDAALWDQVTGLFLFGMDWRLAFASFPQTHWAAAIVALHQAWTLGAELLFYLAAPLLLRSWKVATIVMLASFGTRAAIAADLGPGLHEIWTYHFVGTTFGFFLLGHLICLASQRFSMLANRPLGVLLLVCSLIAMMFGGSYVPFDGRRFWLSVLLFTVSLPGLFEATKGVRWMNAIGNLSYPVYLIHTLTLMLCSGWLLHLLPVTTLNEGYVSILAFLAVTIAAGAIVHGLIEVPVAEFMRSIPRWQMPLSKEKRNCHL
jgi:peptidoglycan/LPS O-acetylase OafA/YrhL